MELFVYAIAFTWTWPGFSPGEGLCNQMPSIVPFRLLYPDSKPPHAELLGSPDPPPPVPPPLPDPPPEPGLLVIKGEPPHPAMTKTWSANANEQRKERKNRNMWRPGKMPIVMRPVLSIDPQKIEMRPAQLVLSQIAGNIRLARGFFMACADSSSILDSVDTADDHTETVLAKADSRGRLLACMVETIGLMHLAPARS